MSAFHSNISRAYMHCGGKTNVKEEINCIILLAEGQGYKETIEE